MDKNLIEEMDILFSKFVSLTKNHGGHLINFVFRIQNEECREKSKMDSVYQ